MHVGPTNFFISIEGFSGQDASTKNFTGLPGIELSDGSTLVHSTGGVAALAGIIILGPRFGRFTKSGVPTPIKPFAASSIPLVTIGVFVLWLGWFGFNGGSQLALGSFTDAVSISTIFINTNLAACGGVLAAAVITRLMFGKTDVIQMLNGAIGGLVAITAEPLAPSPLYAILIGHLMVVLVIDQNVNQETLYTPLNIDLGVIQFVIVLKV